MFNCDNTCTITNYAADVPIAHFEGVSVAPVSSASTPAPLSISSISQPPVPQHINVPSLTPSAVPSTSNTTVSIQKPAGLTTIKTINADLTNALLAAAAQSRPVVTQLPPQPIIKSLPHTPPQGQKTATDENQLTEPQIQSVPPCCGLCSDTDISNNGDNATAGLIDSWSINAREQQKYSECFEQADLDLDGYVSGIEAKNFFVKSGLDNAQLHKIWCV